MYAVQIWTREHVQAAHDDLVTEGKIQPKDFEDFEKDEVLDELERQSRSKEMGLDMSWENLKRIITGFSESREDREIRLRYR